MHREFRQPENRSEHAEHDACKNNWPKDAVEEDLVNGRAPTSPIAAALDDAFEQLAQTLVVDQRLGRQGIIPGTTDLITGGADDGLTPGRLPAETLAHGGR